MTEIQLWGKTLDLLEKDLNKQHFNTWIKPIQFEEITEENIVLSVSNKFIKDWIDINLKKIIENKLYEISGIEYNSTIEVKISFTKKLIKKDKIHILQQNDITYDNNINPDYTFSNFISGSSNQFATMAATSIANSPAQAYNPLFIYGSVGIGKTHLINAIGNEIINKNRSIKIIYCTSEIFTNELINSIRYGKMDEFRNKFRSFDVLLIDDIQFIAGKERTQEEFYHTVNSLYESNKQIVVTSNKHLNEILGLEERLKSKFQSGLIVDMQPPSLETKQAIIEAKAELKNIDLPTDVVKFLANTAITNIRELEGHLVKISAYSSFTSTPISIGMAKDILNNSIRE